MPTRNVIPSPDSRPPATHPPRRWRLTTGHVLVAAITAVLPHGTAKAQAQFAQLSQSPIPGLGRVGSMALGDMDGDGDLDLATTGGIPAYNRLFRNEGTGAFTDVSVGSLPANGLAGRVTFADVDGDSDLDLVYAHPTQNLLYENDGTGQFTDVTASRLPPGGGSCLALGDLDGDGDLDLVVGGMGGGPDRVSWNNGGGNFAVPLPLATFGYTLCITVGDVDADGDLDILVGDDAQNRLYRNDGLGSFPDVTATHLPVDLDATHAVVFGDVDGDGDLDLVCGNGYGPSGQPSRLYQNDGAGVFTEVTATHLPIGQGHTQSVALGDLDGDGDLDLVLGNSLREVGRNDGTGHFVDATATIAPPHAGYAGCIVLGDVDLDGDLDVVSGSSCVPWPQGGAGMPGCGGCACFPGHSHVLTNLWHQLDAPQPLHIGQPWTLDAHVHAPTANPLALVFLSTTRIHVPLAPFGVLGIVPAGSLPLIVLPPTPSVGSTTWNVPQVPSAIGTPIHAQALFFTPASLDLLSNVVTTTIQP